MPEHFEGIGCRNYGNSVLVRDALNTGDNGGLTIDFDFVGGQKAYAWMLVVKPLNLW